MKGHRGKDRSRFPFDCGFGLKTAIVCSVFSPEAVFVEGEKVKHRESDTTETSAVLLASLKSQRTEEETKHEARKRTKT